MDASDTGLAAKVSIDGRFYDICKNFSVQESSKNSTWRELYAIYFSVLSLVPYIQKRSIEWQTDSFAASLIVKKGSSKIELQELSEKIFDICRNSKVSFSITWIPRTRLVAVDALSRTLDYDDWETTDAFFKILHDRWGPFRRDCFADSQNSKLPTFFSKYRKGS